MNSELSPRLAAVARMAAGARILADVGCDHGLLSIYMLTHGWAQTAVASDLRPGPLSTARRNAAGCGLAGRIRFELCDGLDYPGAEKADTVAIAGMGGETIAGILQRAPWTSGGARLILQPQSKISELCRWLAENAYALRSALLSRKAGGSIWRCWPPAAREATHRRKRPCSRPATRCWANGWTCAYRALRGRSMAWKAPPKSGIQAASRPSLDGCWR